jgi:hypothetical protein
LGLNIVRHELVASPVNPSNQTALLLLEKEATAPAPSFFACPACRAPLQEQAGAFFCAPCALIYPIIAGIPCLVRGNGVLGSKFLELT